jgi:hypothetical protein
MSPIIIKRMFSKSGKREICGEQNLLREMLLQAAKAKSCAAEKAGCLCYWQQSQPV